MLSTLYIVDPGFIIVLYYLICVRVCVIVDSDTIPTFGYDLVDEVVVEGHAFFVDSSTKGAVYRKHVMTQQHKNLCQ